MSETNRYLKGRPNTATGSSETRTGTLQRDRMSKGAGTATG